MTHLFHGGHRHHHRLRQYYLPGTAGKLTSIVTMIVGISLFVRLAQALFRPYKITFRCPKCALMRHESDAVHCKACSHLLAIPDDGDE